MAIGVLIMDVVKVLFFFEPNDVLIEKLDSSPKFDYQIYRYEDIAREKLYDYDFNVIVAAPFHRVDKNIIDLFSNLNTIIIYGSGYDNVDVSYASKKGVYVFNIPDHIAVTVAEHAIALILALTRKIVLGDGWLGRDYGEKAPNERLSWHCIEGKEYWYCWAG